MPDLEPEFIPEIPAAPVATPETIPDVLGDAGKRALAAEREQRQQLQQQLKKFEGVDPDEYFRVRQELELERGYADQKLSESQRQLEELQYQIAERDNQSAFYSAVSDVVLDSTSADVLYAFITKHYDTTVQNGELTLLVGDKAISISEAMPRMQEKLPQLFKAPNRSAGAGVNQTNVGSRVQASQQIDGMRFL